MDDETRQKLSRRLIAKAQKSARKTCQCLLPGCNENSIVSHSQQRRGQLLAIAVDGHVYALKRDYLGHSETFRSSRGMAIQRIGIGKVSVFSGFCRDHDNNLFSAIEKRPLCPTDHEQGILLGLRAIAYESAQKRKATLFCKTLLRDAGSLMTSQIREMFEAICGGTDLYVKRESRFYLNYYLRAARDTQHAPIVVLWKVIPRNLELSTSCCICPWLDDYVERWSGDNPQSIVTFSVIPTPTVTHVVVTYPREIAPDAESIRKAFDDTAELFTWIDRLAFAESEDTAVSPRLWESLPDDTRQKIAFAIRHENVRGRLTPSQYPKVLSAPLI
jgi:hypothetical protein